MMFFTVVGWCLSKAFASTCCAFLLIDSILCSLPGSEPLALTLRALLRALGQLRDQP